MFICQGFFVVNNGLFVDLVNQQMLQCIICKYEPTFANALTKRYILHKGQIKYIKIKGITPMNIHVKISHPKFFF
jgi:hypothetical protein